jgi:CRISPR-associated protein Csd1
MQEDPAFSDPDLEPVNLHWLIPLNASGQLSGGPVPLTTFEGKKRLVCKARRPATSVNEISVRSLEKAKSYFLCDTLERVLLLSDEGGESGDPLVQARHRYFKRLLRDASPSSPGAANAIISFMENSEELARCRTLLVESKADSSENCTFQVLGQTVLEDAGLIGFWRQQRANTVAKTGEQQICLVTGQLADTVGTTEKVKGIGGQDTNLISANEKAFQSYGLEQAKNSPISSKAEKLTRVALNELISKSFRTGEKQSIYHLHWTREPVPTDIFTLLESADEAAIRNLLAAPQTGHAPVAVKANAYYAMSLSGNGGRIVVRDWLESTVPEVEANIRCWFENLSIISPDGSGNESAFKLGRLLYALVRDKIDELPPQLPTQLLYAALRGTPLPQTALVAALRRQQIETRKPGDKFDPKLNPARLALIKACLIRTQNVSNHNNQQTTQTMTECLNPESRDPAYLCGRLFAVFAELQGAALQNVNAGVVERYYASASVTPALVMGRLFRNAQFHSAKAEGEGGWKKGKAINAQKDLEAITCALGDQFPATLDLEGQGRFALGYYHQKAEVHRRSAERKEQQVAETAN